MLLYGLLGHLTLNHLLHHPLQQVEPLLDLLVHHPQKMTSNLRTISALER